MVGSAVLRLLKNESFERILAPTRKELDLREQAQVNDYFAKHRPVYVFMIAAKVGGIAANEADPVGFLTENTRIQMNLLEASYRNGAMKNLFLGSSCVYPRDCEQPMKEEYLLTGPLEPTNEAYSLAKISGLKLAQYYWKQFGMRTISPMPCNIYGTNDCFDLHRSHVLSALVRRFVDARDENAPKVELWGTGSARREFIHVEDVANALLFLMDHYDSSEPINVGTGTDISVADLALLIKEIAGYEGQITWDPSKPDGMPRKCVDISKLISLGYRPQISLEEGIQRTVDEYRRLKAGELIP
jgi:GDP-L-fucose synthase